MRALWLLWVVGLASGCRSGADAMPCLDDTDPACRGDEVRACTPVEASDLFNRRIAPLLRQDRPSSCNGCHMVGLELSDFVRGTPCRSMGCLVEKELVDLEQPAESKLLELIGRGVADEDSQIAATAETELAAFRDWIEFSARCHGEVCGEVEAACGPAPVSEDEGPAPMSTDGGVPDASAGDAGADADAAGGQDAGDLDAAPRDRDRGVAADAAVDGPSVPDGPPPPPEPCSDLWLDDRFSERVWPWHDRCYHCHAGDGIETGPGDAPSWMARGHERTHADQTFDRWVEWGLVDPESPDESLVLLKPLAVNAGGIEHRGGTKFRNRDDPAYRDFRRFVIEYARCANPDLEVGVPDVSVDLGLPDVGPPDVGPPDIGPPDASLDAASDAAP